MSDILICLEKHLNDCIIAATAATATATATTTTTATSPSPRSHC